MGGNANSGRNPATFAGVLKPSFTCKKPSDFSDDEAEYWNQIVPMLTEKKQLADTDFPALCRLCRLQGDLKQLDRDIARDGLTVKETGSRGQVRYIRHPAADLKIKIAQLISTLERKFGLTPADREDVKVDKLPGSSVRDRY